MVREALREAKTRLQEIYGERLRRVILYGSQTRGEAHPDSDVDVLVMGTPVTYEGSITVSSKLYLVFGIRHHLDFNVMLFSCELGQ